MRTLAHFIAACVLPLVFATAQAEEARDFPSRTVRLIVPAAPGGPIDAVARILADGLKTQWPVPVVIENRAGAGTSTGAAFVAAAPPDGYTLLVMPDSITVNPSLYPNVNPDPLKSFEPIALIATAHPAAGGAAGSRRRGSCGDSSISRGAGAPISTWHRLAPLR